MTPQQPITERLAFLRREIARHDQLYYVDARPEIGDADYDLLYRELETLERQHPELYAPDSPTQRVGGAPLAAFTQIHHDPPMMSLDKTHAPEDLREFDRFLKKKLGADQIAYVVEPKIDGVAFSLRYEHGTLIRAATRGNGDVGDDITQNVRTIRTIPLHMDTSAAVVELRGEVFIPKQGFLKLTQQQEADGETPFMNPRNAAAGSLKLLNSREVAQRPLDAVLYATGALDGLTFATHAALLEQLTAWGFRTPQFVRCDGIDAVLEAILALEKKRHDFPFEMDGAVIKMDSRALYDAPGMGATAKSPRWARAFKYEPERAETVVNAITVQVGRTGVLTPVAELNPVRLAGSIIARATLHNAGEIARKDIRVGDHVWIVKAGDVIPAIENVILEKRTGAEQSFVLPEACPACQGPVTRQENEAASRCTNPICPAQRVARLEHFAARNALNIEGVGGVLAEVLVTHGLVIDPLDLFALTPTALASVVMRQSPAGKAVVLGEKNARKIIQSLEHARTLPLARWLFALGIPRIGITVAEQAAACHASLNALPQSTLLQQVVREGDPAQKATSKSATATAQTTLDLFPQTPCPVKYEAAKALLAFFASTYGRALLQRLDALGIHPVAQAATVSQGPLSGQSFAITGTLSMPRAEMESRIKAAGGKIIDAVTHKTTFLVIGEDPGGTKYRKAQELHIPLLTEPELLSRLNPTPLQPPTFL